MFSFVVSMSTIPATSSGYVLQQGVQVSHQVVRRPRLRNRVAAAGIEVGTMGIEFGVDLAECARTVVAAHAGEFGNGGLHHRPLAGRPQVVAAPDIGASVRARLEYRRGAALATALQVQRSTADVDRPREVTRHRCGRGARCGTAGQASRDGDPAASSTAVLLRR
jgi:hypothetical protein